MKIFELLLIALALYYFFVLRPKSIKNKKYQEELKRQNETPKAEPAAPVAPIIEKMVACAYCKVRLPDSEAITVQDRSYCSPEHCQAINPAGFLGSCKHVLSDNYDVRPENTVVDTIVIHHISLPEGKFGGTAIEDFFCNRLNPFEDPYFEQIAHLKVSAHFLIKRNGEVVQFVSTLKKAWHAGVSNLLGRENCNDFSIGIELEGTGEVAYEASQYEALRQLVGEITRTYPIENIVGHSDIAPDRKQDPGKSFDWHYFSEISQLPSQKFPFGLHSR